MQTAAVERSSRLSECICIVWDRRYRGKNNDNPGFFGFVAKTSAYDRYVTSPCFAEHIPGSVFILAFQQLMRCSRPTFVCMVPYDLPHDTAVLHQCNIKFSQASAVRVAEDLGVYSLEGVHRAGAKSDSKGTLVV